jgi:hypothetical protein
MTKPKEMYDHAYQYGINTCNSTYNCPYPKGSILEELYDHGRVAGQRNQHKKSSDICKILKRRNHETGSSE